MTSTDRAVVAYLGAFVAAEISAECSSDPAVRGRLRDTNKILAGAVKLLPDAWSPMAIRNLLSDILRSLLKMKPDAFVQGQEALRETCDDLIKRIEAGLGAQSPTKARYTSALCLGYKVKTAGNKFSGKTDEHADMVKRADDMKRAVRNAYRLADIVGGHNANPQMLKIFMAPEFFFRGRNGAYDFDTVYGVGGQPGLLDLLSEETDRDQYDDWLFILGTVILAAKWEGQVCKKCRTPAAAKIDSKTGNKVPVCTGHPTHKAFENAVLGARVDNLAIVRKQRESHFVAKELVSHIDFVTDAKRGKVDVVTVRGEELGVAKFEAPSKYKKGEHAKTAFQDERMGGCIFTIDGITFGLEVCLDHAATKYDGDAGRLEHAANIQVQLIPSAGMGIGALRTVFGGVVFNVDGITPHVHAGQQQVDNLNQVVLQQDFSGLVKKNIFVRAAYALGRKFGKTIGAPRVASGGSGSVISLGPYDIPTI